MKTEYKIVQNYLYGELDCLTPMEVIDHLRNYVGNFLLDPVVATAYINRINRTPAQDINDAIRAWFRYLVRKLVLLQPFHMDARHIQSQLSATEDPYLEFLKKIQIPSDVHTTMANACANPDIQVKSKILQKIYHQYPYSPFTIEAMMLLDIEQNNEIGASWLDFSKIPPQIHGLVNAQIVQYSIIQKQYERCISIFEKIECHQQHNEVLLNCVAEAHWRLGNRDMAIELFEKSLQLDPMQIPIQSKLDHIRNGFQPQKDLLDTKISIFLYSYNKSALLHNTLISLAHSERGNATIAVLLNNCTDDSSMMLHSINEQYFNNAINVIHMPTNIGAPAARNWLLTTEQAKNADYIAFLDDDVEIPSHWLATLLTALDAHPKAGVAGAKIVYPGEPTKLQYLYRNVAVARPDLIRISLDTPNFNYDFGFYDFVRETHNVMGCCHVFTKEAIEACPEFDIRFSPSQMDDIAHDIELCIHGYKVIYCGLVECRHHQVSGIQKSNVVTVHKIGNVLGNDVKFFYKFSPQLEELRRMNNLHLVPAHPVFHDAVHS